MEDRSLGSIDGRGHDRNARRVAFVDDPLVRTTPVGEEPGWFGTVVEKGS
jgi:hypothetical protein